MNNLLQTRERLRDLRMIVGPTLFHFFSFHIQACSYIHSKYSLFIFTQNIGRIYASVGNRILYSLENFLRVFALILGQNKYCSMI